MSTVVELNALRIENEKLKMKLELMQKLCSTQKFYQYYFSELKNYKTNTECFNAVNDQYLKLFGVYRYSDWDSFKKMVNYYHNKNK